MRTFIVLLAVGWALCAAPALAGDCPGKAGNGVEVTAIGPGPALVLSDARKVMLWAIIVPVLPRDDKAVAAKRAARTVELFLKKHLMGKTVHLSDLGKADRRNRTPAHVRIASDSETGTTWLQQELVSKGLARASGTGGGCAKALLAIEEKARRAQRGFWASGGFKVRRASRPGPLYKLANSFQIVEGTVRAVGKSRKVVYLSFGDDWRKDFTVAVRGRAINTDGLEGKAIRVRGWLSLRNGPLIDVFDGGQIERLGAK
ncbi:MAG: thermonuclease family protein [Hyphomicrobiales bacterium]